MGLTFSDLKQYRLNPNVAAFLRIIREGESNQTDDAYTLINGGGHFTDFSKHPYDGIPTTEGGKAAGAFQDLGTTWKELREQFNLLDFTPKSQELGNIGDIANHGVLQAIVDGDPKTAFDHLQKEWVSLTDLGWDRAKAIYQKYGGTFAPGAPQFETPPPEPVPAVETQSEAVSPALPSSQSQEVPVGALAPIFLQTILPSVIGLFSQRAQATIAEKTGASPDAAAAFMQNLMQQVSAVSKIAVTDQTSAIQAVAAVTHPDATEQIAQLEQHCLDYLDKVGPMIDKLADFELKFKAAQVAGMDAASLRGARDKYDLAPVLARNSEGLAWFIVAALIGGLGIAIGFKVDLAIITGILGLAGPIIQSIIKNRSEIYAYRFDGSTASTARDTMQSTINDATARALAVTKPTP